jgi:hypothetical protein
MRKPLMELGLHVARFLKKLKMIFESFKKNWDFFFYVYNYGIYYCVKKLIRNSFYFRLSKNDKSIDLDLVKSAQFKSLKFWQICYFS